MNLRLEFAECLECRCLAARKEAQRLTRDYDQSLGPHELTVNQFSMLAALIAGGPTPLTVLAERLGVDRTTMTRNIGLAQSRGLVAIRSGEDARERIVSHTDLGLEKARAAMPAWRDANTRAGAD